MENSNVSDVSLLLNMAAKQIPSTARCIALPKDFELRSIENYLPSPLGIAGHFESKDPQSMAKYVERFATPNTAAFQDDEGIHVYFDFHNKDRPSWCSHSATFTGKAVELLPLLPSDIPVFQGNFEPSMI